MSSAVFVKSVARRASVDLSSLSSLGRKMSGELNFLLPDFPQSNPGARRNSTPLFEVPPIKSSRRNSSPLINLPPKSKHAYLRKDKILQAVKEMELIGHARIKQEKPSSKLGVTEKINFEAREIFNEIWAGLCKKYGEGFSLPKEVVWLAGAPGSGKGTNTSYIQKVRNISAPPIVMSSILNSDACKAIKAVGGMVGDKVVLKGLLEEMCKPEYANGVIVDGFPRTAVQVEFIHLLHQNYSTTNQAKPDFRVAVFHIPEGESVSRQLTRGEELQKENSRRAIMGLPPLESRPTDLDPVHAAARYHAFSVHYGHLLTMNSVYPFHLINTMGSKDSVRQIIERDLAKKTGFPKMVGSPEIERTQITLYAPSM